MIRHIQRIKLLRKKLDIYEEEIKKLLEEDEKTEPISGLFT